MIGIFHIFMWYFLLVLYMGQIKGAFGTYEPVTYKTGCTLWGIFKLGREVSRILLFFYGLEFSIALTHSIYSCSNLFRRQNDLTSVTEEAESTP
ncbi:membrane-spanning 4-domains subfamily A member 13 isoform 3 [Homo sapiens]|uniref:Isoform 3 of Membrane-spanning 4-domains subfamily A member 13 n=1 Tax=Homo sapiens TaxID=9606 RepID=Q5J8X5-3|nr:membrane-spanning 4-domains subfamily A member 13 isoform 3 precursor [Homo sapiens]XP_047282997.1 membrane-spanning 4-domains subfamily A member 13 isoform X2 [Homo sapiens]AAQ94113.1 testis-expressed transmembrane-4 protein splice variant a [Homo sapiens]|eukprot:NP_001265249.1 membrane-spanning 4-domains subfamily A member 13 isoform 3 precursor [Homo sapiens]